MKELKLISPIPPSVNHYMSYRAIMRGGKPLAIPYKQNDVRKYQRDFSGYVCEEVKKQGWELATDPDRHLYIDTTFFFPEKRMDANNYFKVMLDTITDTGKVWFDDDITCERVQGIFYDTENPRVEMVIHPTDYIGIFSDMSQLEEFVSRCIGCARYKRNCSILRKAKEGRVQREIKNNNCSAYKEIQQRTK